MALEIMVVLVGLSIGFMGSLHCVGMCGPLALALPLGSRSLLSKFFFALTYNVGRSTTYALMGLMFGYLGKGLSIFGIQQWVSIVVGVLILLSLFGFYLLKGRSKFMDTFQQKVSESYRRIYKNNPGLFSYFGMGMLNGLLPCGLVYVALGTALTTFNPWNGAMVMFAFGLGTIPALLAVSVFKEKISQPFRNSVNKVVPYMIGTMAVLLILRGLNLGIPFISPKWDQGSKEVRACCKHKKECE